MSDDGLTPEQRLEASDLTAEMLRRASLPGCGGLYDAMAQLHAAAGGSLIADGYVDHPSLTLVVAHSDACRRRYDASARGWESYEQSCADALAQMEVEDSLSDNFFGTGSW